MKTLNALEKLLLKKLLLTQLIELENDLDVKSRYLDDRGLILEEIKKIGA